MSLRDRQQTYKHSRLNIKKKIDGGIQEVSSLFLYRDSFQCRMSESDKYNVYNIITSLPYFGVKLSCVCHMFAYRKNIANLR